MNQTIYEPPRSNLNASDRVESGRKIAILGSALQIPLFIGVISTVVGFIQTFQAIKIYGSGDPKLMAGGISSALVSSIFGGLVSIPGYIVTIYVLNKKSYRPKWYLAFNVSAAILWLLHFPIGTIMGSVYIVLLIIKRNSKINA